MSVHKGSCAQNQVVGQGRPRHSWRFFRVSSWSLEVCALFMLPFYWVVFFVICMFFASVHLHYIWDVFLESSPGIMYMLSREPRYVFNIGFCTTNDLPPVQLATLVYLPGDSESSLFDCAYRCIAVCLWVWFRNILTHWTKAETISSDPRAPNNSVDFTGCVVNLKSRCFILYLKKLQTFSQI